MGIARLETLILLELSKRFSNMVVYYYYGYIIIIFITSITSTTNVTT